MTATIKNARRQPQRHPKIEKGVPVPGGRKTSQYADLAKQMEPGDSVAVPTIESRNSLYSYLRSIGYKPLTRKLSDGTYRVWRVE